MTEAQRRPRGPARLSLLYGSPESLRSKFSRLSGTNSYNSCKASRSCSEGAGVGLGGFEFVHQSMTGRRCHPCVRILTNHYIFGQEPKPPNYSTVAVARMKFMSSVMSAFL